MYAGLRKVIARMGISTLASYRNSHLFEVLGLDDDICREYFDDAGYYPGTKTLDLLLQDYLKMHAAAYAGPTEELGDNGLFRFRKGAELHANSPEFVRRVHAHVRKAGQTEFTAIEQLAKAEGATFLRDLLEMVPEQPVALSEVEPLEFILRRFSTQAMSLGSLSPEAHKTLSIAMNQMGGRSNTGEGGEDPDLYAQGNAACKVKQVASGRFGVTTEYLVRAEELEIKMAQGSKPGEGGQLPARKVTEYIARIRYATPGTPLISPPPHHDIYSIEDLAQLIHDLRAVNPNARIGVKLVSGSGIGVIAAGVAKAGANVITVSGHNGGTGSSPLTSIKNTGLPWEIGLRDTHETLLRAGLRSRVALRVDGGMRFARDILIGAILGADEFGFGTAALVAIGCVMARQCHLNTCPVGIATQDETLRMRFNGKPEMVVEYFRALGEEVRKNMSELGVRTLTELRGWYDRLETSSGLDALLVIPPSKARRVLPQQSTVLDSGMVEVERELDHPRTALDAPVAIQNFHRSIGTHLSGERMRRHLSEKESRPVTREFQGSAGQSFGAFLSGGLTLKLCGEANDYVGKGLSGGMIVIGAGHTASKRGDVLAGNTVLYGATSGQLFIAGQAGERFAVRNSGAVSVVEGLGQHGCEYMTGGIVAVLGPVGLNFGSGMTGGLAYVLRREVDQVLNLEFVQAHELEDDEERQLRVLLEAHVAHTGSPVAFRMLLQKTRLPFLRIQPVHFQGTLETAWRAFPVQSANPLACSPGRFIGRPQGACSALCLSRRGPLVNLPVLGILLHENPTMDFDQLTTFVQVAKLKSFSKAGQKVFRSQSAVSAQIRQLEQAYRAKLLDRSAKSVELTPAGEVLFEFAERLLHLRDESMQVVADRGNVVQGPVSFGANEATCLYLLPDILSEFQRKFPLVRISIYRNFSHKILQRLEEGTLDLGIVTLPLKSPNLKTHTINRDRLRFMVSAKNPLAQKSHTTLEEIASAPLIFPKTGYTRQVLDKLFRPYRSRLRIAMELPSIGMIKTFVAADVGISIISESFARDQVKSGEVKLLNVDGVDLWRELALVYRRDRSLPRAVQSLITMIRENRKLQETHPS